MHLISSLLFGFSANIDSLIIGLSYGIRKTHISMLHNTLISLITCSGTVLAIEAGKYISPFLSAQTAKTIGCIILILLGMYYALKFFIFYIQKLCQKKSLKSTSLEEKNDTVKKTVGLRLREAIMISLTLSANNMGMGIGASFMGMMLLPTAISTWLFCSVLLYIGNHLGKTSFFHFAEHFGDLLSGLILIGLGLSDLLL